MYLWILAACFLLVGFIYNGLSEKERVIPVVAATSRDWNPETFWYEPWGSSIVHMGIDIFAEKGTPVVAPVQMLVYRTAKGRTKGGNTVRALGPDWKVHYFAHLDSVSVSVGDWLVAGEPLGTVGNTGNALGKPAHLHYGIYSLYPRRDLVDDSTLGHRKAYVLNPIDFLSNAVTVPSL